MGTLFQTITNRLMVKLAAWLFLLFGILLFSAVGAEESITIEVWYGSQQTIYRDCLTQQYANILGRVRSSQTLSSLSYRLNNGRETALEIGPNLFRLAESGDFNVDIPITSLRSGPNLVLITAVDESGRVAKSEVTLSLLDGGRPSGGPTETIDWAATDLAAGRAVVIDGFWEITPEGLKNSRPGYDRLVGLCPMTRQNFEITVPVTIHAIEPRKEWPSNGSGVGLAFHWNGHERWNEIQPAYGWYPIGGFNVLSWDYSGERVEPLEGILLNGNEYWPLDSLYTPLEIGQTYFFKLRSEHVSGFGSLYRSKVWPADQAEPAEWLLLGKQYPWHPYFGSILLVSHHADVTFGTVEITNLNSPMTKILNLLPFFALAPLLLLSVYAVYQAVFQSPKLPIGWRRPLLGAGLTSATYAIGKPALDFFLPPFLHTNNQNFETISAALTAGNLLLVTLMTAGLGWLLVTVVRRSRTNQ